MLKKLLIIATLLLLSINLFGTETGTITTRDVADFVRILVINENAGVGAQAGFRAENDQNDSLMIYIEKGIAGDSWIRTSQGKIKFNVPAGKDYEWYVNDVLKMGLSTTGLENVAWHGSIIGVTYGGTGKSTLAPDGGILLSSGEEAPITVMDVLGDGEIIVGDGTADPVALAAFTTTDALRYEAGGLQEDISGYSGLVAISGGVTSEVDSKSELEAQIVGVTDFAEASGDTWSGNHEWWDASLLSDPDVGGIRGTEQVALRFEGSTEANSIETFFVITNPTTEDKVITFQDHSGIVATDDDPCYDLEGDLLSISSGQLKATIPADHITEAMLKAVDAPADEDILTYETTTGNFEWHTPAELITAGTNLAWDGTTLNASSTTGDMRITYGNYLYWWHNGATADAQEGNWRDFCNASGDLVREYYISGAWVEKREETP